MPQAMWSAVVRKGVQGGTGLLGNGPNRWIAVASPHEQLSRLPSY